jgi:hypothetical protein
LIAAALSMTWASDASALTGDYVFSGAELLERCLPIDMADGARSYKQGGELHWCLGFMVGAYNGDGLGGYDPVEFHTAPKNRVCIQPDVTYGTLARVVLADLAGMKKLSLELPAMFLVRNALMQAYPCPTIR